MTRTPKFSTAPQLRLDAAGAQAFEVDAEKRTVRGLLVPYGRPAYSGGLRWQFAKGSLTWADVSRVKLLVGHDFSRAIGVAVELDDREDGLYGVFRVARGEEGDRALALAEDGVLDGFSVGIGMGGKYRTRAGIQHAVSAPLQETSLTPVPAFDDARVQQVAASADNQEGTTMTPEQRARLRALRALATFTAEEANEYAELVTLEASTDPDPSADIADTVAEAIRAGFAAMGTPQGRDQSPPAGGRLEGIDEAAPYRFDGGEAEHDFSTDLFAGIRFGDAEALQRVTEFVTDAFAPAFAPIESTDVGDLNPERQRPDLYVDRLVQPTPLWNAIQKGTVSDATPFVIPKFGSSADLVDDHVEGVEPDEGSFTATKQTITPTPLSGKVGIPREVVDQGGNPQVSGLIWREMQRRYFEALEAKASALFDGLTLSGGLTITIPQGLEDSELVNALEAELADLQFADGGFRFDYAAGHRTLYKRLAAAEDSTGRKLLPRLNPTNSNGSSSAQFAALDVAGVGFFPGRSLQGTDADGVRNSYLFATEDAHGWASPPRRLDFETKVAVIDMAIWGYVATACTRTEGVRRIAYNRAAPTP